MARRRIRHRIRHYLGRHRRRGHVDRRLPILPLIGLAQNFIRPAPSGTSIMQDIQNGDFNHAIYDAREIFLGVDADNKFRPEWLLSTYAPIIAGALGSKLASTMGVNRTMKRIPFVGRYIKL